MARISVISLTGQYWKVGVGVLAVLVGSFAPLVEASGLSWTWGTVIAVVGYSFTCLAVRCPACGGRWFWHALLDASLYVPLFKGSACPQCKRDLAQAK